VLPHRKSYVAYCVFGLLLLPSLSSAQRLMPTWDFPRAFAPAPDNFILAQTQSGQPEQQARVALSAVGICPGSANPDTFCTMLTSCPPPGSIVAYWVYAQWGEAFSKPTNIATCLTKPGEPCVCHDPGEVIPPPGGTSPPVSLPPAPLVPPPVLADLPPAQVATVPPQALALASPTVPLFKIPAAPASAGT
jgi:hypothetical protein